MQEVDQVRAVDAGRAEWTGTGAQLSTTLHGKTSDCYHYTATTPRLAPPTPRPPSPGPRLAPPPHLPPLTRSEARPPPPPAPPHQVRGQ